MRDDTPRGRGLRQLDLLYEAVTVALKRELELCERLTGLAQHFKIDAIDVIPDTIDERSLPQSVDHLLDPERRAAIAAFLEVWLQAWDLTREAMGAELGD
ncbi:hypothetical protein FHS83_000879 [Rhizomicrobium palustre]|uniref:Uncharacterized protein n=1 Tax=Rhizomicrobium palustre TaxID=189966 RepID=A0A846MWN3_9PROT|nr:hypothetical protein [Rhizomicrobium palustre]NIK87561.1 hypothetical protein [Rhizomicrobium palustre]